MNNSKVKYHFQPGQGGFSLLEVLIAIAIFAIGMLALASLQGALTRSTAEAKVRTTAVDIAEKIIERQLGFELLSDFTSVVTTPSGSEFVVDSRMLFKDEADLLWPVGVVYTATQEVTDFYYDLAGDADPNKYAFTTTAPSGVTIPDFKTVTVTVKWDRSFVIDEDYFQDFESVQVSATISNVSVAAALKVSEESVGDIIAPVISYTPGLNPDIVALEIGPSKFKESLTPEPKVYRDNLETRFDVITYAVANSGAFFLRREEFVAVSCECTLNAASADNPGKTPAVWAGDEYTEPAEVTKAYGTAIANVAQSPLCSTCCRDHHDGGDGALYDPSRPAGQYSGENHKHYSRNNGSFTEAAVGDDYVEACRFVRKDGFFRLTQDFRLEGLNTFPEDYLVTTAQVGDYSDYVTKAVYDPDDSTSYVPKAITTITANPSIPYQLAADPPTVESAARTAFSTSADPADLTLGYTYLPTSTTAAFQQLRSRSIYIDNMSSDLLKVISCIESAESVEAKQACKSGDVELDKGGSNVLELIPFFELQTTYLNDWQKSNAGSNEFSITNDTVSSSDANGPTHSRGLVTNEEVDGFDMVNTIANRGVTGVTSTEPINDIDTDGDPSNGIENVLPVGTDWPPGDIKVITGADSPTFNGRVITGTLSSEVNGLKAANVNISASEAICNYATTTGKFTCFIPESALEPTLTVSGFDKPPKTIYLCSNHQYGSPAEMPVINPTIYRDPKDVDMRYAEKIPVNPDSPYFLYLTEEACPIEPEPCEGFCG